MATAGISISPKGRSATTSRTAPGVHYVMRGHNSSAEYGGLLSMTFEIATAGNAKFNYKLAKGNTCDNPAHVRAMLQKRNDDMYKRNGRFWANPIAWKLKATNGTVTLNIPLTIENWSNVSGQRDKKGFQTLLGVRRHLRRWLLLRSRGECERRNCAVYYA